MAKLSHRIILLLLAGDRRVTGLENLYQPTWCYQDCSCQKQILIQVPGLVGEGQCRKEGQLVKQIIWQMILFCPSSSYWSVQSSNPISFPLWFHCIAILIVAISWVKLFPTVHWHKSGLTLCWCKWNNTDISENKNVNCTYQQWTHLKKTKSQSFVHLDLWRRQSRVAP